MREINLNVTLNYLKIFIKIIYTCCSIFNFSIMYDRSFPFKSIILTIKSPALCIGASAQHLLPVKFG
jgi:hypothetical protein